MKKSLLTLTFLSMVFSAFAQDTEGLYGSISSNEVNVRVGPGTQYPISWVYKQKRWPVEAVAKHQGWYKIRDIDGEEGWIYQRFFSKKRYTLVQNSENSPVNMYKKRDGKKVLFKFEPGSIIKVLACELDICKVAYGKKKGWMQKKYLQNTIGISSED